METILWLVLFKKYGAADRAVHEGTSGRWLKTTEILTGPQSLVLRVFGLMPFAVAAFIVGSFVSRFAWVMAGGAPAKGPATRKSPAASGKTAGGNIR